MTITREEIDKKLNALEKEISETRKRLPAHSIKPPVMMDLLALEDERDELLRKRERLEVKS